MPDYAVPVPSIEDITSAGPAGPADVDLALVDQQAAAAAKRANSWKAGIPLGPITIPWIGVAAIGAVWFLATRGSGGRRREW